MPGWLPLEMEGEPSEVTPTSCPGPADPIKQISDPCPHRLAGAQNVQIWTEDNEWHRAPAEQAPSA